MDKYMAKADVCLCLSVGRIEFWKCLFVTATKTGKLQSKEFICFLDTVINIISEVR
jgi:hypothetical protein